MNISPKKLSIDEMWKAYKFVVDGIPDKDETYLFQEVIKIMEGISTYNFKQVMAVFYGEDFHHNKNPLDFAVMFVKAIKQTKFIEFLQIIKSLRGNSR